MKLVSRGWASWLILCGSLAFCLAAPLPASAHELRPAVLSLSEVVPGKFDVRWSPALTSMDTGVSTAPEFPAHCKLANDRQTLDCGGRGLVGELRFSGLKDAFHQVHVRVVWANGFETQRIVGAQPASLSLQGAPETAGFWVRLQLARDYVALGMEHILRGADHLLFVFGLVVLVRFTRRLIWTITSFTLAHSITLASTALGLVSAPSAFIEAAIALSILLVAVECAKPGPSLSRRVPWLIAFCFGLLHGFGFAGALAEIGLAPHHTSLSLAFFNVGVELGQLAAIGVCFLLARFARKLHTTRIAQLERGAVYVMGSLAAFWSLERGLAVFASGS